MAGKKSRGLGKGLDALFGDVEVNLEPAAKNEKKEIKSTAEPEEKLEKEKITTLGVNTEISKEITANGQGISYIDINDIKPNSNQPRKTFDEEKLDELAASIKDHGLIQPVVLRSVKNGYEIVAGERRWRAARKIGITEIPCIVKELTDEENMLLAIIENMQREDLNPIEEAEGIHQMIDNYGLTQEQVSKSVGKSRPYITNCLRLLKLPEAIQAYVSEGKLSSGHARAIVSAGDETNKLLLAELAIKEDLSVRQIEKMVQENRKEKKPTPRARQKNADVKRVEADLKDILGTKVNLNQRGKKGKIEIEFYSREDLERLIELLKTLN